MPLVRAGGWGAKISGIEPVSSVFILDSSQERVHAELSGRPLHALRPNAGKQKPTYSIVFLLGSRLRKPSENRDLEEVMPPAEGEIAERLEKHLEDHYGGCCYWKLLFLLEKVQVAGFILGSIQTHSGW